jgi:hypothetical protein
MNCISGSIASIRATIGPRYAEPRTGRSVPVELADLALILRERDECVCLIRRLRVVGGGVVAHVVGQIVDKRIAG